MLNYRKCIILHNDIVTILKLCEFRNLCNLKSLHYSFVIRKYLSYIVRNYLTCLVHLLQVSRGGRNGGRGRVEGGEGGGWTAARSDQEGKRSIMTRTANGKVFQYDASPTNCTP